jgi:hypothetical protein
MLPQNNSRGLEKSKNWHGNIFWVFMLAIKFSNDFNKEGLYIVHKMI